MQIQYPCKQINNLYPDTCTLVIVCWQMSCNFCFDFQLVGVQAKLDLVKTQEWKHRSWISFDPYAQLWEVRILWLVLLYISLLWAWKGGRASKKKLLKSFWIHFFFYPSHVHNLITKVSRLCLFVFCSLKCMLTQVTKCNCIFNRQFGMQDFSCPFIWFWWCLICPENQLI
jgi:hypothetical protein